jgi:hypothetical protein
MSDAPLLRVVDAGSMRHLLPIIGCALLAAIAPVPADEPRFPDPIDVTIKPIGSDKSVEWNYPIAYVRAQRAGDKTHKRFYTDFSTPVTMEPGADLMLLHPDGQEEVLAEGGKGSITDPFVSLDGKWIYFTRIYNLQKASQWNPPREGADIFKIHVETRRVVRLTNQQFVPNEAVADWSADYRTPEEGKSHIDYGVYNMGASPLPGGKIIFTSNREGVKPAKGYPAVALQLFVMDDSDEDIDPAERHPNNLTKIGHLNLGCALHPVALKDGRVMFSSLESQGIRGEILWGIWTIHPDGTNWAPLVSAFDPGGAPNGFHFQTQLGDGSIVIEQYYNQNNSGFGAYIKMPPSPSGGYAPFGPASMKHPRNVPWRYGRFDNGKGKYYRMPFMPTGAISMTPFTFGLEGPADRSILGDKNSPAVGKFTHPSGAPDNHLLTVYSPGPVNHQYEYLPQLDGGIYLAKGGAVIESPADLLLIKNDPDYNESWPRAVVPYESVYGIKEPVRLPPHRNDGSKHKALPEGTPFGIVGSASLYKRETYPNGAVPDGKVVATYAGGNDPWKGLDAFTSHGNGMPINWHNQGADAGLYSNDDIHAVRILAMEPTTDRQSGERNGRRFFNHATERLRILGEIPVRKIAENGEQPLDPDGNPDTSFLAKIPADTAFTFQTLDKRGMVLNMAQTWHQLRPGEVRNNCGGCHAHSQSPTDFAKTAAAQDYYELWDLTKKTPLLTNKQKDESTQRWDTEDESGLRIGVDEAADVEYFRDIRPIFDRSCVTCHSKKEGKPAGNLVLDADDEEVQYRHIGKFPGSYYRLALDEKAQFGHKPVGYDSWGYPNASRYVRKLQARRSLLVWKIFGERLDGFSNDDHPSESKPGERDLVLKGEPVDMQKFRAKWDLDFTGKSMPPPKAIEEGSVKALSDEDRRTIVRWIDLGCPIDLDKGSGKGGWFADDNRPVLTLQQPASDAREVEKIVIGTHDYYSGIDTESLSIRATFAIGETAAGDNLAPHFKTVADGVWTLALDESIQLPVGSRLEVSVWDKAGNESRIVRRFGAPSQNARTSGRSFPARIHVFEDFETEIEKRWWLRGSPESKNVGASLSSIPNARAMRAAETKDFDRKMGDPLKTYKAVIFNPVPGPPMGGRTRLSFRYWLAGSDKIRAQIYSLSNNYHRRLELTGLPQGEWQSADIDMTEARRPDGSGGPLVTDERIDDIQFYIDSGAELLIDDIVLYEAPAESAADGPRFPQRVIFTGWFDTGIQGKEWPGEFEIVQHEKPLTWDAAKSVPNKTTGTPWVRIGMRGERRLGARNALQLRYRLSTPGELRVAVAHRGDDGINTVAEHTVAKPEAGSWAEMRWSFEAGPDQTATEIQIHAPAGSELLVDDVLLFEPN